MGYCTKNKKWQHQLYERKVSSTNPYTIAEWSKQIFDNSGSSLFIQLCMIKTESEQVLLDYISIFVLRLKTSKKFHNCLLKGIYLNLHTNFTNQKTSIEDEPDFFLLWIVIYIVSCQSSDLSIKV